MATAADTSGQVDQPSSSLSGKLNCPICLEVYKTPRALSCLHTFCQTCVQSYIAKAAEKAPGMTAVDCPVCRTPTASPSPGKPPAEWARALPLNYALIPMLESMGSESESRNMCDSCTKISRSNTAQSYCKDCRQYQCNDCVENHIRWPALERHRIVSLQDLAGVSPVDLGKAEYCSIHVDEAIKYYCQDHSILCCSSCAIVKHRGCKQVLEVTELGHGVKNTEDTTKLLTELASLQEQLSKITLILEANALEIDDQADAIVEKMREIRNTAVQKLDDLVDQVSARCNELKKAYSTEIADKVFSQRSLTAAMSSSCTLLESILKQGTEPQIFITFHKLQNQLTEYKTVVKKTREIESIVLLELELDKDLNRLIQSTHSLANVTVKQLKLDIVDPTANKKTPIADCKVEIMPWIELPDGGQPYQPLYSGAAYLQDGRLVTADRNNSLCCLLDEEYNVTADIELPSAPTNLAVTGEAEVAIVLPNDYEIQVVTIGDTLKLTRTITSNREPMCVARAGDTELAVGWETGFSLITHSGEEKNYVSKDRSGRKIQFFDHNRIAVDTSRSRIYQSCWDNDTVYCYGLDGQVIFIYTNQLDYPAGLCLDKDGNVYICSWYDGAVHQVSPDGDRISVIDPGKLGLYTVCVSPAGDQLLLIDRDHDENSNETVQVKFSP